ncbi:MAG: FtsB family cell division protein [Enterococcus sp.]
MPEKNNKIASLNTEYAKKQYAEFQKTQRQLIFRRRRLIAIFVGAFIIFAIIGTRLFSDFQRLYQLDALNTETKVEQKSVDSDVTALKKEVALLKDDDYVAKLARSRYFYSKDGELVYPLPDSTIATSDADDEALESSTSSTTAK